MTILHSEKGESVDLAGKGDFVFILADFYFFGNSSTVNKFLSTQIKFYRTNARTITNFRLWQQDKIKFFFW